MPSVVNSNRRTQNLEYSGWSGYRRLMPAPERLSHSVALFTNTESNSVSALIQGLLWWIIFGLIAGTPITVVFKALAPLEQGWLHQSTGFSVIKPGEQTVRADLARSVREQAVTLHLGRPNYSY